MDQMIHMPSWVTIVLAILSALGGFEFIKWLINIRSNKRKSDAVASQENAKAGQEDVLLRRQEYELLTSMLDTNKAQYLALKQDYDEIRSERIEQKKEIAALRMSLSKTERIVFGLQKAMKLEVSKKKDAEMHYCCVEGCENRKPKIGEYHTETVDFYGMIEEGTQDETNS